LRRPRRTLEGADGRMRVVFLALARNGRSPGEESRPAALPHRRSRRGRSSVRSSHERGRLGTRGLTDSPSRRVCRLRHCGRTSAETDQTKMRSDPLASRQRRPRKTKALTPPRIKISAWAVAACVFTILIRPVSTMPGRPANAPAQGESPETSNSLTD
jgi:hypothetical protein